MGSVNNSSREQFEQRMRTRRVATCLAVARSAIAGGRLREAIERLEEACSLDPDAAEPRLLLEELRAQPAESEGAAEPALAASQRYGEISAWSHWLAAAIAICVLAALAFLWPPSRPDNTSEGSAVPVQQQPAVPSRDAPAAATDEPATVPVPPVEPPLVGTTGSGEQATSGAVRDARGIGSAAPSPTDSASAAPTAETDARAGTSRQAAVVRQPLPIVPAGTEAAQQAAAQVAAVGTAASSSMPSAASSSPASQTASSPPSTASHPPSNPPLPPVETSPVVADDFSKQVPSEAVSPSPLAAPAALTRQEDVPADADMHSSPDPSEGIADTLRRYAEAYTRLDADAAHAVWPTVDERALARAFDGLASQRLVLEHCDVTVKGGEATAACRGRAGYVPKVGNREPLVEQRLWTFRLRRSDSGWQIVQADAR